MTRKLEPGKNGAAYPTLKAAKGRRLVVAGVSAATLAVGVGCFPPFATQGEPPSYAPDTGQPVDVDDAGGSSPADSSLGGTADTGSRA